MTQAECETSPLLAIINGYIDMQMHGTWRRGEECGLILVCAHPWQEAKYLEIGASPLIEEEDYTALAGGEVRWLRVDAEEMMVRID